MERVGALFLLHTHPMFPLSLNPTHLPAGVVPHGPSREAIQREVSEALVEVLGSSLAPDEPLMSGGLDSLGAVEYVNLVSRRLGVVLPSTLVSCGYNRARSLVQGAKRRAAQEYSLSTFHAGL